MGEVRLCPFEINLHTVHQETLARTACLGQWTEYSLALVAATAFPILRFVLDRTVFQVSAVAGTNPGFRAARCEARGKRVGRGAAAGMLHRTHVDCAAVRAMWRVDAMITRLATTQAACAADGAAVGPL